MLLVLFSDLHTLESPSPTQVEVTCPGADSLHGSWGVGRLLMNHTCACRKAMNGSCDLFDHCWWECCCYCFQQYYFYYLLLLTPNPKR